MKDGIERESRARVWHAKRAVGYPSYSTMYLLKLC